MRLSPKRVTVAVVGVVVLMLTGACGVNDKLNEARGRGDSPVGSVDDTPKEVIQFPDRFSSVAHACDGHGHRVFVTTKSDNSRMMQVIDDPSCGGTK